VVQFGATDTSDFVIVTGLTDTPDLGGALIPAGIMSVALGLPSSPPGILTTLAVPTAFNVNPDVGTATGYIKFTNSSPAGCDTTATVTGTTTDGICTLSVAPFGPSGGMVEGDTPSTQYYTTKCTCTGEDAAGLSGANLVISASNCPISGGTGTAPSVVTKPLTCNN
jgi:hypothetical protein